MTAKPTTKGARRLTPAGVAFLVLAALLYSGWHFQTERYITPQRGLGYALGRSVFAEMDLTTGRLVRSLPETIKSPMDFFAVWRADSGKVARIAALAYWIEAQAGEGRDQGRDPAT